MDWRCSRWWWAKKVGGPSVRCGETSNLRPRGCGTHLCSRFNQLLYDRHFYERRDPFNTFMVVTALAIGVGVAAAAFFVSFTNKTMHASYTS